MYGISGSKLPSRRDFGDDLRRTIILLDAEILSELIDGWQHRDRRAKGNASTLKPGNLFVGRCQPLPELEQQAGLSDPSIAGNEDHLSAACFHVCEKLPQGRQGALAANQWRQSVPPPHRGGRVGHALATLRTRVPERAL
jgi:hypothetical protein